LSGDSRRRRRDRAKRRDLRSDASHKTVLDNGAGGPPGPLGLEQKLTASGRIKSVLHGPEGDPNGLLLEDGTIIRMRPPEAARLSAQLTVRAPLAVHGSGYQGDLGRVIAVTAIGPSATQLEQIAAPPSPPPRG
jgi:hypothetical protein